MRFSQGRLYRGQPTFTDTSAAKFQMKGQVDEQTLFFSDDGNRQWAFRATQTFSPQKNLALFVQKSGASDAGAQLVLERQAQGLDFATGKPWIAWIEGDYEVTRFCTLRKEDFAKAGQVSCPLQVRTPRKLEILGSTGQGGEQRLWIKETRETLYGNKYKLKAWRPDSQKIEDMPFIDGSGNPLRVADYNKGFLFLVAERQARTLLRFDEVLTCIERFEPQEFLLDFLVVPSGKILYSSFEGPRRPIRQADLNQFSKAQPCSPTTGHVSPLILALNRKKIPSLAWAMEQAHLGDPKRKMI